MKRITPILFIGLLLALFTAETALQAAQEQKGTKGTAPKSATVTPRKAQPAEMPAATGQRDKLSATGFHDKEQDEPTQLRPNPIDAKAARDVEPGRGPVPGPGRKAPR